MLGKGLALRAMSAACSAADALSYHLVFSHFISQCLTSSAKCAKCYCPNLSKAKCSAFEKQIYIKLSGEARDQRLSGSKLSLRQ